MIGRGPRQVLVVPKSMVTLQCRWCRRPRDLRCSCQSLRSSPSSVVPFSRHHRIHFIRVIIIVLMEAAKITREETLHHLAWSSLQTASLARTMLVTLEWIPAHCGIWGNEQADSLAKAGSRLQQPQHPISFREAKNIKRTFL